MAIMPNVQEKEEAITQGHDSIERLIMAWRTEGQSLKGRVASISSAYFDSRLRFDAAVRIIGCSAAELQATLYLAGLDDEALDQLSALAPAITTWYLFASANEKTFSAGIEALKTRQRGQSSFMTVFNAMCSASGPNVYQRLGALSSKTLWHLATKAKQYNVLSKAVRAFLGSIARQRQAGKTLTQSQLDYLKAVVEELVKNNVISSQSMDSDQKACDEVLDALGR